MVKKIRVCDICGNIMSSHASKYKVKNWWFDARIEERITIHDMCEECYQDYKIFVRNKRGSSNG